MPTTHNERVGRIQVGADDTLMRAIERIEAGAIGACLLLDADGRLVATISDGDVRRALLAGFSLTDTIARLHEWRRQHHARPPLTGSIRGGEREWLELMRARGVRQLPLLDDEGRVRGIVTLQDLIAGDEEAELEALVMAGGLGRRLHPLTIDTPKPMLHVGGRPILEHIVDQLRGAGIRRIHIATCFLAEKIATHFGDGGAFGVDIRLVHEDQPLGTAGAVGLLGPRPGPLLVMNGDVITKVDIRAMDEFHRSSGAALTVAVRNHEVEVPYGVLECEDLCAVRLMEKPVYRYLINAGIYILEPPVCALVPRDERLDMPQLISRVIEHKASVAAFPVREYWLDVGLPATYEQANRDARLEAVA